MVPDRGTSVVDPECSRRRYQVNKTVRRTRRNRQRHRVGLAWTPCEVTLLTELYPTHSNSELAARLGRSEWAISGKARSLGLTRRHGYGRRRQAGQARPWSSAEINLLRKLYPTMANEDIAEEIGRSRDAVAMKARQLKLHKMWFWTPQEDQYLRECYQQQSCSQMAHALGRTVLAVKARAVTLGLRAKVPDWTEDEVNIIWDSYGTVSLDVIATNLGRTRAAVAKKARKIGLIRFRHWSQEDTKRLEKWFPSCTVQEIARRLDRSVDSVRRKMRQLNTASPPCA